MVDGNEVTFPTSLIVPKVFTIRVVLRIHWLPESLNEEHILEFFSRKSIDRKIPRS